MRRDLRHRIVRRGDNIPPISAYAHWNEDAARVWYEENKYDMLHADEIVSDEWEDGPDYEPEPFSDEFDTEAEAQAFFDSLPDTPHFPIGMWKGKYVVDHYDAKAHARLERRRARH